MFTLEQIADRVGGAVRGRPDTPIEGVMPFAEAGPADITLAARRDLLKQIESCSAAALIVPFGLPDSNKPLIEVENPKLAFAKVVRLFHARPLAPSGIGEPVSIGKDCVLAEGVSIQPFVTIGDRVRLEEGVTLHSGVRVGDDCSIGQDSVLYPNVVLYQETQLGRRVYVHAGSVIGSDGFGYVSDGKTQHKVPQIGRVRIEDDVEVGSNCTIDRATFGETVIQKGVKIDNLVHIGHNCWIGENTIIIGCVGISGSVQIGKNCILAGQAGVIDHIQIGDNVRVMVKTAVTKDVPDNSEVSGQPSMDHRKRMRIEALTRRLPDLHRDLKDLKRRVVSLESEPASERKKT